jgi:hypothetical protein
MIRGLAWSLFILMLRATVSLVGVIKGIALGFSLGVLVARAIVALGLGPPPGACGLAGLLLVPELLTGAVAGAIGAAVGRVVKGTLAAAIPIAVVAVASGVWIAVFGGGDAITRGSTVAIAGTVIGTGAAFVGSIVGAPFVRLDARLSSSV